jgi:hypothetical protein
MKTKSVIIIGISAIAIGLLLVVGYLISPGSYPDSERYNINKSQMILLSKIDSFKSHDNRYNIPALANVYDSLSRSYHVYIYNYNRNQIIHLVVQQEDKNQSTLRFTGINQGLKLGNWKMINKDFNDTENEAILSDFEKNILRQLGIVYKRE